MLKTEVHSTALLNETASRSNTPIATAEVAGYHLQQRIGTGGFGEVWRAIGPGGFPKAVKILFGNLSGPQAETEMRSLNRMRELRHPFLLSVERVEVIDGRVVIVTELADRSLEDRFKEVVATGQRGIPREELLGYLRDAADALDFMSEQHGLQHLDVKPDNLLLQGCHAKVGDFGLTKSLSATGHSLVNGFTPLYAPPELFDGRPERGSDQYSLAIVYQTMLTGTPPFNGRSAAQLTSQHLKSAPDLSCLHPSDRAVVARALSKSPKTRFPNCRQFIDELFKRRYANSSLPKVSEPAETSAGSTLTHFVEDGAVKPQGSQLLPPAAPLRPPGTQGLNWFVRPTLFVGVGGLGMQTMEIMRQRLQSRFPDSTIPSMHFVCIDADAESIDALERQSKDKLSVSLTTIRVPLKTSHDYRKAPSDHLNWLSRRWLFNIPRSGKVEGMRPLGRLAYMDHQESIRTKLQKALDQIFQTEAVLKSQTETQLPFSRDGLDIVLVGATTGGTCSGSLLDIGWLVKSLISEKRLPPCNVSALLIHGTGNGRTSADMQDANTLSFLKELNYFSLPGLQSRSGATVRAGLPLDEATLLHLGDDLTGMDFQNGVEKVADYLELRAITPVRLEMDSWRKATTPNTEGDDVFQLRTFGMATVTCDTWDVANAEAAILGAELLQRWSSPKKLEDPAIVTAVTADLSTLLNELALTQNGVVDLVPRLLNPERTRRVDEYASGIRRRLAVMSDESDVPARIAELISQDTASTTEKAAIAAVIEDIRKDLSAGLTRSLAKIAAFVQTCVDGRGRLAAADHALSLLTKAVDETILTCNRQKTDLQGAFTSLCESVENQAVTSADSDETLLKGFCRQYCMLLLWQTVCQNIASHLKTLREAVLKLREEQLPQLRKQLSGLAALVNNTNRTSSDISVQMLNAFEEFLLKATRFRPSGLLNRDARSNDAVLLTSEAANFLFQSFGPSPSEEVPESPTATTEFPGSARPLLRNVGGGQRVVATVPEQIPADSWKSRIQNEFGACVTICPMNRNDITVICEVEGMAISAVMDTLSSFKPKVVELAERVHSRQDIPW